jgi:hypothetical protein
MENKAVFDAKVKGKDTCFPEKRVSLNTFLIAAPKRLQLAEKFRHN